MFREFVKLFPQFVQKTIYEHDISHLKLPINTTQTRILMLVSENKESPMCEISAMTGLEKSSFTRSVDHLVQNGLIVKIYPEHDRRITRLALTAKGSKAAERIVRDFDSYLGSIIAHLSETEKAEFIDALRTMSLYMRKIIGGPGKRHSAAIKQREEKAM